MSTYGLILQYDGSRYNGWQKQGNTRSTIQEKIETLVSRLYDTPVEIAGSGRTDAGVHALGQVASFRIPKEADRLSVGELRSELNRYLPQDIRVLQAFSADERFHARLLAEKKVYEYRLDTGETADVFRRRFSHHMPDPLDLDAMRQGADLMVGTHDFLGFSSNRHMKKSSVRTIYSIEILPGENTLTLRYCGDGFLYHMVRILTGTLIEIGLHRRTPESVITILHTRDRSLAGRTVPPEGLFLVSVFYSSFHS